MALWTECAAARALRWSHLQAFGCSCRALMKFLLLAMRSMCEASAKLSLCVKNEARADAASGHQSGHLRQDAMLSRSLLGARYADFGKDLARLDGRPLYFTLERDISVDVRTLVTTSLSPVPFGSNLVMPDHLALLTLLRMAAFLLILASVRPLSCVFRKSELIWLLAAF